MRKIISYFFPKTVIVYLLAGVDYGMVFGGCTPALVLKNAGLSEVKPRQVIFKGFKSPMIPTTEGTFPCKIAGKKYLIKTIRVYTSDEFKGQYDLKTEPNFPR